MLALLIAMTFQCADGSPPPCRAVRAPAPSRMSVAVLDFENLSRDTSDAWLASGLAGELTSRLGQVSRLTVASRAAVRRLHNPATMRLADVGRELNVVYLVNGSVQRSANRLRVTAELVRANGGAQLWTAQYDRSESDLLVVQESVATAVATAISGRLLPAEQVTLAARPTANPEAYALYVRARAALAPGTPDALLSGIPFLERALALDSAFVDAWGELARAQIRMYWAYVDRTEVRRQRARVAAERAASLAPTSSAAHLALGYYHYWGSRDYGRALQEFSVVLEREPGNADVHAAISNVARRQGDWNRSVTSRARSIALDPRNYDQIAELGNSYGFMRRFDEAERALAQAQALTPIELGNPYSLFVFFARDGDAHRAPDRLAGVASDIGRLDRSFIKDAPQFTPAIRLSEELQSAILLAAPPPETDARAAHFLIVGTVLATKGRQVEATVVFDSARVMLEGLSQNLPYDDSYHAALGRAYAGLGRCEDAMREGERATELLTLDEDALAGAQHMLTLAEIEAKCGRWDQAMVRVELLLARPAPITRTLLRVDPVWAPLKGTPRYERLIAGQ